jgi:hypothetical protein
LDGQLLLFVDMLGVNSMITLLAGAAIGCVAGGASCFAAGMGVALIAHLVVSNLGGV